MSLTQKQRDQIRYALEDQGIPEVLAFMAAQNATEIPRYIGLTRLFTWASSPQGHEFWAMVAAEAGHSFSWGCPVEFPDLSKEA